MLRREVMPPKRTDVLCRGESVGLKKESNKGLEKCFDYLTERKKT